jgi:CheY-like chemotaxis protein
VDSKPRILVVDDEEAILETMTFTFQPDYEVITSTDARRALRLLDEKAPVAAVLTDQRMPGMSGVEFVTEVCRRHPRTVRMILTGFSDMEAIVQAINDGHVYAYIAKPWEPDQLKQLMKQAVEHHQLSVENERLLVDLRRANVFLEAVMDELDTGALALDAEGVIQAANRPVREYLSLAGELRGRRLSEVLESHGLARLGQAVLRVAGDEGVCYEEVELGSDARLARLRVTTRVLADEAGWSFGRVILVRETSHEPFVRRFDEILREISQADGELRGVLERSRDPLRRLAEEVRSSGVGSSAMGELAERLSRTLTAVDFWLDVDEALARESFPDAQVLQDRMRISLARWPLPGEVPGRVRELARRVEDYYESGENPKQHVL